jgi:hypothetical protein
MHGGDPEFLLAAIQGARPISTETQFLLNACSAPARDRKEWPIEIFKRPELWFDSLEERGVEYFADLSNQASQLINDALSSVPSFSGRERLLGALQDMSSAMVYGMWQVENSLAPICGNAPGSRQCSEEQCNHQERESESFYAAVKELHQSITNATRILESRQGGAACRRVQQVADHLLAATEMVVSRNARSFEPSVSYVPQQGDILTIGGVDHLIFLQPGKCSPEKGLFEAKLLSIQAADDVVLTTERFALEQIETVRRGGVAWLHLARNNDVQSWERSAAVWRGDGETELSEPVESGQRLSKLHEGTHLWRGEVLTQSSDGTSKILWWQGNEPMMLESAAPADCAQRHIIAHNNPGLRPHPIRRQFLQVDDALRLLGSKLAPHEGSLDGERTLEAGPAPGGLERLCSLVTNARLPIFVRVTGRQHLEFDGPVEPSFIQSFDGFLSFTSDAAALSAQRAHAKETLPPDLQALAHELVEYEQAERRGKPHEQAKRLEVQALGLDDFIEQDGLTSRERVYEHEAWQIEKLGETLEQYLCKPVLILSGESEHAQAELQTWLEKGWSIVAVTGGGDTADGLISEVAAARSRDPGAFPQVRIVENSSQKIGSALEELGLSAAFARDQSVGRKESPLYSRNAFMRFVQTWSESVQCEAARAQIEISNQAVDRFDRSDANLSSSVFTGLARTLKSLASDIEELKSACLAVDIEVGASSALPATTGSLAALREELKSYISPHLENKKTPAWLRVREALDGVDARLGELLLHLPGPAGYSNITYDESLNGRDLLRVSQLMEMARNDIEGPAGSLHGMMYGDMSPARFADFMRKGTALVAYRDRAGEILGFMLYANPVDAETIKPQMSARYGKHGNAALCIAIAVDPRSKEIDPLLYSKLTNALLLHQMRSDADIIAMRVHPRNLKALVPHMATAGFRTSSSADEMVDGMRFLSMYFDLAHMLDQGRPGRNAEARTDAVKRAWELFFGELEGREEAENKGVIQERAARLLDLIEKRLEVWDLVDAMESGTVERSEGLAQFASSLSQEELMLRPESVRTIEATLSRLINTPGDLGKEWSVLLDELGVALIHRSALERDAGALRERIAAL